MKGTDIRCRKCRANVNETGGWLTRVNEKGVPGIWECRPSCEADLHPAEAIMGAIEGRAASSEGEQR